LDTLNGTSTVPEETSKNEENSKTMQWYAYGHDLGNSEICATLLKYNAAKQRSDILQRSMPTAFTQVNPALLKNMGVDTSTSTIIRMQEEQASYGIGPVALVQGIDAWNGRGDIRRYASRYSLRALLALSASLISDQEYGLMVVTGLPVQTFQTNRGLRDEIKAGLQGKWTFTIDNGVRWRTCHIEVGTTVMEGAGALFAYGTSNSQAQAVIDIGGGTTDLYVTRGQVPAIAFCKGKPLGVETAVSMVKEAFQSKHGVSLTATEARGIMFAYAEANGVLPVKGTSRGKKKTVEATPVKLEYPEIVVTGNIIAASEIHRSVHEAVRHISDEIVSFVSSAWRESDASYAVGARFHPVIAIGGGTFYFYDALKKIIPHLARPTDPLYANALGYARAAENLLVKKLSKTKA
jgi:hypothetical protein